MKKLVRNFIPNIVPKKDEACFFRATSQERVDYLYAKLQEEIQEFKDQPSDEEMADILEVIDTIIKFHDLDKKRVLSTQQRKRQVRGGFDEYIIGDFS